MSAYARRGTRHRAFEGMDLFSLADGCGWVFYAENRSALLRFNVGAEFTESFNLLASRRSLSTIDVVPPRCGQVLQVRSQLV